METVEQRFTVKVSQMNEKNTHKLRGIGRDMGGRNSLARFHWNQATLSHPTNPLAQT